MEERLQKIISRAGFASRRAGEELILAGRVRVNGRIVTELGAKADLFKDTIEVDGRRLVPESPRYIVLHKPRNVVSTLSDPEGRPTVAELLREAGARLYPVGRLDFATSGVLLITNDGEFANGLLHPRGGVPKTYVLKVKGLMTDEDLDRWREGVELDDGKTLPAEVRLLRHEEDKTWFEVTLREGRNQQIRRMGEATGFPVMRLARTSFAGITSEGLRPGAWRSLTPDELLALRKQFGVPKRIRGAKIDASSPDAYDPRARRPRGRAPERERAEARPARKTAGGFGRARDERHERPARGARSDERPARAARPDERPARPARRQEERPAPAPRGERPTRSRAPEGGAPRGPRRR
jgi:23S rRNA pseudouridine2605 synthase